MGDTSSSVRELDLIDKLKKFQANIDVLSKLPSAVENWTENSVEEEANKAWKVVSEVEAMHEQTLPAALFTLRGVWKNELASQGTEARQRGVAIRACLGDGAPILQGMPKPLGIWIGEEVFTITHKSKKTDELAAR